MMRRSCVHFARCGANITNLDRSTIRRSGGVRFVFKSGVVHETISSLSVSDITMSRNSHVICRHFSINNVKPEISDGKKSKEDNVSVDLKSSTGEEPNDNIDVKDLFDCIDYDAIVGNDSDSLNKFKLLLLEVEVLRQDGMKVPSQLSTEQWKELFSLESRSQRRKCLGYLWTLEMKKQGDKRKKESKRLVILEKKAEQIKENENNDHIRYGFQGNTIFMRIYDSTINLFDNSRLIQAMMFGQNIVLDCGYENNMSAIENKLCAKQLTYMFAENRLSADPFNIHFCNMNKNGVLYKQFLKHIPTIEDPAFPVNISEEHYLDHLFPKEKLVYLTPHCRDELRIFSADDIYIVGALVDKQNNEPLSLAKAKSEGIRMAQLPLDRYLDWGLGTKSLTINQVLKILLDVRTTGDWNRALTNVPKRKVKQPGEQVRDTRKFYNRGTTFQPPNSRNWRNRYLEPIHQGGGFRNEETQEKNLQRSSRKTS
ncbi:mitochondrial ribonuclease P protein 1 homolog [Homalodisca vitripennis]|uniref:mitochondrial ribonuclease P protein 1 homolog n=1 Tax=Homalodisca vitripennis TaxID=197043 RepID=UPI001EEB9B0E|nr:mitochondrial ribonuclease P protein 1 homolog [Homalodisca vitripennis]